MKLLYQSDDYGMTDSVTFGILKGIELGVIKNTGMFVNMPASAKAAACIKEYPHICLGQDINLVAGCPITNPKLIPSLVDKNGVFISSVERMNENKILSKDGNVIIFEKDPYDYDEVLLEVENQVLKFIALNDKKPQYLHGHSLSTPNIRKAMHAIARKYDLKLSHETLVNNGFKRLPVDWNPKPFSIEKQLATDVETNLISTLKSMEGEKCVSFICHCGFVEQELFEYSTYTMIRTKDLQATISQNLKKFIETNNIELVTYNDLI